MNERSNTFIETLKASFFLNFDEESFQLEKEFDNYVPMLIWIGILCLIFGFLTFIDFLGFSLNFYNKSILDILFYLIIGLCYIAIPYGTLYFLLQNKLTNLKPLNLLRNLTYSLVIMIIYSFILFTLKIIFMYILEIFGMYPKGFYNGLVDVMLSLVGLIIFQTLWYILMSIYINFKKSQKRVLLSQIFIGASTLGLFLLTFFIDDVANIIGTIL